MLVIGLTLIGEGLNETVNPALRRRRLQEVVLPARGLASSKTMEEER
jgi:peptide/nickel transport system permease protein